MNTQYTIRNIPSAVDKYLRKKARLTGNSLNQVVINELSSRAGIDSANNLDWFIGSGLEDDVLVALEKEDKIQKQLAKKELKNDN